MFTGFFLHFRSVNHRALVWICQKQKLEKTKAQTDGIQDKMQRKLHDLSDKIYSSMKSILPILWYHIYIKRQGSSYGLYLVNVDQAGNLMTSTEKEEPYIQIQKNIGLEKVWE